MDKKYIALMVSIFALSFIVLYGNALMLQIYHASSNIIAISVLFNVLGLTMMYFYGLVEGADNKYVTHKRPQK